MDKYVKDLQKNQDQLNELRSNALFKKTLEFVLDKANVTEVEAAKRKRLQKIPNFAL